VLAGAAARSWAQAPPVFRSSVEAVYVDVSVSRGGQRVPGLPASSFELRDNGVRQEPELVAAESRPLRAVLVFDTSSSLAGERLAALKAAGDAFLTGLRPDDQVALVAFSEEIAWLAASTPNKDSVHRALDRLEAAGATAAFDALYSAVTLSGESGRALIVLFTDGEDNVSFLGAKPLAAAVERSNALVHVVGWRPAREAAESDQVEALRQIAEGSGGRLWEADSPDRLRRAFAAIADAMGHRYVLRYEPQGVKREGWHRIDIKLRGQKGDVQARHGYWVAPRVR
jgi:VWFA-related protein